MDRLLVTDIDGTITHCPRSIDPSVLERLSQLYHSGWQLFFLTGRFFSYAHPLFEDLHVPYLLGCQNGACLWSSKEQDFFYTRGIPREMISLLEGYLGSAPIVFCVESGALHKDRYYRAVAPGAQEIISLLDRVYFPTEKERDLLVATECISSEYAYDSFAVAKFFGRKEDIEKLAEKIRYSSEMDAHLSITLMRWPFDFAYSILFVTDKKVSKGFAVDYVVESLYHKNKPFMMVSGDDANDIDLLTRGDFKIVMNTSPHAMHEGADFLALPAKDIGILQAWEAGVKKANEVMGT